MKTLNDLHEELIDKSNKEEEIRKQSALYMKQYRESNGTSMTKEDRRRADAQFERWHKRLKSQGVDYMDKYD